jgi:hypothetical protein
MAGLVCFSIPLSARITCEKPIKICNRLLLIIRGAVLVYRLVLLYLRTVTGLIITYRVTRRLVLLSL